MPGNTSIDKSKCDSVNSSVNSNSVSKLFYGLLNSKNGLDLIRNKKCHQSANNPQLRRSFKLLKVHRSESNLPFKQPPVQPNEHPDRANDQLNGQLTDTPSSRPILTGSLGDLKMKSNPPTIGHDSTLLTTAQIATVVPENDDDESPPPTPPIRNTSLLHRSPPLNQTNRHSTNNQLPSYPNYNRELPSLPNAKNDEKRKSISFTNRLSPISDGGFNSFDFNSSPNKRNSISVFNHPNFNHNPPPHNYRNHNLVTQSNHSTTKYNALIGHTTPSTNVFQLSSSSNNLSNSGYVNNYFQETNSNLFNLANQRNSYFSDVDQHLDLDYQNINSNPNSYALSSQKSDNWSSSTSVLSTYTGITSSSTSDYYTASSETITNSPSLSSLNSAICGSSMNNCNSPPLNSNCNKANNLARLYSGSALVNNNISNKNVSYMRQFSYPGSQLSSANASTKLAKSPALPNTGIAISSLVEKPKRQESASVLYYIVAKDSNSTTTNNNESLANGDVNNTPTNEQLEQQVDKKNKVTSFNEPPSSQLNESHFNKFSNSTNNFVNYNSIPMNESHHPHHQAPQTDLKAIQKSLHEFYLRHRGNSKACPPVHQFKQTANEQQFNNQNLIDYSLTSNDSACSDSSTTVSPTDSPTLFPNRSTIQLPAKPSYLSMIKQLTPEEERRLNELKANAIYTNIHFESLDENFETKDEDAFNLPNTSKELRLSFRERCSPFENKNSTKQSITENKTRNELNLNQPNSVKNIAKQFDNLSNQNCDLNANRVSPVSIIGKVSTTMDNNALSDNNSAFKDLTNSPRIQSTDETDRLTNEDEKSSDCSSTNSSDKIKLEHLELRHQESTVQLNDEDYRLKLRMNEERIKLFLSYLNKNELSKFDYNKIICHIEEVDKVTKLIISLTSRLNKIESILQLRNNQQNGEQISDQLNDSSQLFDATKFKQSTSTDSLLNDEKNLFSSILSLSSISLNNLNCNGTAFFASIEMLNSKRNKILDQLDEAAQLKQMIERRCKNLNDRIICRSFDFSKIDFETPDNQEFQQLKDFDFINSMQDKHELSLKCREQCARLAEK